VVPEALILGSKEFHVEKGSTITLVCIIEKVGWFTGLPQSPKELGAISVLSYSLM
jgi:hypothetical protein